ncbi:hypothetical protein FEM03_17470 [Phragmitibacter flavus]|uniref:Lipoprotein n=1 Tax=Phragmitibacter flavus TaxID=2576071 RepID=A0A5R8KAU2_9BACT|nr:hypothetical protein [Phragmitibacter flavus]TLD69433.1 hypothetical protein FEM03_17470 [Phragmitibacter flavus]
MKNATLLKLIAAPFCLALASCASTEAPVRTPGGQSLDQAPPARFSPTVSDTSPQTGPDTSAIADDLPGTTTTTTTTTSPGTDVPAPPVETQPPVIAPGGGEQPVAPAAPSYGKPVPGRVGFVYPPGVEGKPENMVDVRDFTPGQKVRDPRTGKIFLVP